MTTESEQQQEPQPQLQQAEAVPTVREMANIERQRSMGETVFGGNIGVFTNGDAFRLAKNMAEFLGNSTMIPKDYQGRPENVLVAIDYAARLGISPFALMNGMDIVRGRPALRGQLYSGVINASKLFSSRLKYEWRGQEMMDDGLPSSDYGCRVWAYDHDGDRVDGPWVDWKMVTGEGWNQDTTRQGGGVQLSKWNTMRELMFKYRAAAFFGRTEASDLMMGIYQHEELQDAGFIEGDYDLVPPRETTLADRINQRTEEKPAGTKRRSARKSFAEAQKAATAGAEVVDQQDAAQAAVVDAEPDGDAPPAEDVAEASAAEEQQPDAGQQARADSSSFNLE